MPAPSTREARPIRIALVNNMPDAAFVDTEHQFQRAILAGGQSQPIEVGLYTMPGLSRDARVAGEIRSRYNGLDELWASNPDALIITGTEPVQTQLQYEPYWPDLSQLIQWATENVPTTLLSCLAAHASLLIFDGLERQPLPAKCSGVFEGAVEPPAGALANGLPPVVPVPHSRVNDIPEALLVDAGYSIVIGSGDSGAGWSVASRVQGASTFVLCQGHLEYSTESLLREYRRDLRRFLFSRGAVAYPNIPSGYLTPSVVDRLEQLKSELSAGQDADPLARYESFPYAEIEATLTNRWEQSSAIFYRSWLELASAPVVASAGGSK
jgi:homoserine O-succinyltransferase/O-acetyltransferase